MVTNVLLFIHPVEVRIGEFVRSIQTHPYLESKGWRARKELAGINVEMFLLKISIFFIKVVKYSLKM